MEPQPRASCSIPSFYSPPTASLLMEQSYILNDQDKLELIARTAFERSQPRHQEGLRHLRLLASTLIPISA